MMFGNNLLITYTSDEDNDNDDHDDHDDHDKNKMNVYQNKNYEQKESMKESFQRMCRKAGFLHFFNLIDDMLRNGFTSDRKIIQILQSETTSKDHPQNNPKYDTNRSKKLLRIFKDYWDKSKQKLDFCNDDVYVDIGAGSGTIASMIGEECRIKKENIYCLDVSGSDDFFKRNSGCNFITYNGTDIPFKENDISLVTLFMVLHHVKNLEQFMENLSRVMKPGGIVFVRDHDATPEMLPLLHSEHYIWIIKKKINIEEYESTMVHNFMSKEKIKNLFCNHGFEINGKENEYTKPKGEKREFFICFRKNY